MVRDGIAVIIPCYNEALTIGKVIDDFRSELPEATVYVYDNNSTDGTAEIASDGVFDGIDRLARVEPAAHAGRVLERPSAEILQEVDPGLGTREVGGRQIERPGLESLGVRPGGVVDIVA